MARAKIRKRAFTQKSILGKKSRELKVLERSWVTMAKGPRGPLTGVAMQGVSDIRKVRNRRAGAFNAAHPRKSNGQFRKK